MVIILNYQNLTLLNDNIFHTSDQKEIEGYRESGQYCHLCTKVELKIRASLRNKPTARHLIFYPIFKKNTLIKTVL